MNAIIEKTGNENGYDYVVKFFEDGHRCGYVRVPEGHKFYDKFYSDIDIDCHGGLTFSSYVTERNEFNGLTPGFWIGFDCAHYRDVPDIDMAKAVFGDNKFLKLKKELAIEFGTEDGFIRTSDYVETECLNIIRQLIKIQNGEKDED